MRPWMNQPTTSSDYARLSRVSVGDASSPASGRESAYDTFSPGNERLNCSVAKHDGWLVSETAMPYYGAAFVGQSELNEMNAEMVSARY